MRLYKDNFHKQKFKTSTGVKEKTLNGDGIRPPLVQKKHTPSPHQIAFNNEIKNTKNNILLSAVAGSGKTTTILGALNDIPPDEDCIFVAFANSIINELKHRAPDYVEVSTIHSIGLHALYNAYGSKIVKKDGKIFDIALQLIKNWKIDENENKYYYCARINKLVDIMRLTLTTEDETEIFELATRYNIPVYGDEVKNAIEVLKKSDSQSQIIDFTDMVYWPAVRNIKLKRYKYVFVDELQDLNRAQQEVVKKLVHPKGGRFIGVGDPNQSIYGFAGADFESFNRMYNAFPNTVVLPLSVCYRCTQNIVKHAQQVYPEILPYEKAEMGEEPREGSFYEVRNGDIVVCRNTKPLVAAFVELLKRGKKANIKGKEVGKNLITLINKTGQKSTEKLLKHLEVQKIKLKVKLAKKGIINVNNHEAYIQMAENVDIIKILSQGKPVCKMVIDYIDTIFLDDQFPGIILTTIHKFKGLEADRIFVLFKELIPSKFAKTERDLLQEKNLRYVMITRAKKQLIYINDFVMENEKKKKQEKD